MKKFALLLATWIPTLALFAAPVGDPSAPQLIQDGFFISRDSWIDVRVGYEGDFVSDARMEQQIDSSGRVDGYKQNTNAGTLTLNILDRLDLYGVFGSSRTSSDWRFTTPTGGISRANMQTMYNFLWGIGARGVLFEWGTTSLGLGGRYASSHYQPAWLTINGANANVNGALMHWKEWQVDLDVSYKIDLFTPYIGLKYSSAHTTLQNFPVAIANNGSGNNHFHNRIPVGIFLGCSLSTGKYFMLNIEGRLVDEEAFTISGDIRF